VSVKRRLPLLGQPDPDVPKDVHLVGRYALGVTWADDHGSIYPFDHLRRACPCCGALAALTLEMQWPLEIKRLAGSLRVVWSDAHASDYPYPDLRAACRCAGCTGGH
jgi:DUF971 family protein